jgi:EAL domain-containing protein (putative c-di-GMP-specific phosphodiesterase class I)
VIRKQRELSSAAVIVDHDDRLSCLVKNVKNGLASYFQPVYSVGESMPFAVEGFIRGPLGNALEGPEALYRAADETGRGVDLDRSAYAIVLEAFAQLHWTGKLFLNIRPSTLMTYSSAVVDLQSAIEVAGLHPSQIILELTEHEPIPSSARLLRLIDPLLDQGLTISLDDVGAGYASMRAICELQPHVIKVDRFFITGIADSQVKRSVVQNFANLASDIGAQLVAEGIEREEDARTVVQLGILLMQGHLFGKPTAEPDLAPLAEGFWREVNR